MKRIANIILTLAAAVCLAASCQKEEASLDPVLVGTWHLDATVVEGTELDADVDVYLVLNSNMKFALYQKTGSQNNRYDLYTGDCNAEGGVLTGTYSNGTPWGSSYKYKVTGSTLKLTSSDNMEEQVYVKESLPTDIKVNTDTKSTESQTPIL